MEKGQEQFFGFMMERIVDGKQEEAKALLMESFGKQTEGSFTREYLEAFNEKMIPLVKPEAVEEVKGIFAQFGGQHTN